MHVAIILPNLMAGGTERVTLDLIGGLRARGARVDLVLMEQVGEFLGQVPDGVRVIGLDAPQVRQAVIPLRRYFRSEQPDAALAAMWPLTTATIAAAAGLPQRPRIVVADHAPLLAQYAASPATLASLRATIRLSYRFADAVVAASEGLAGELAALAGLPRQRVRAIYNPIPKPRSSELPRDPWPKRTGKRVIAVGRLKPGKGFEQLIEAFAPLAREQGAVLTILGEGGERGKLEAVAARLSIAESVILPGFTETPGDWLETADLFVSASEFEGFGNVLVEALHFGLPVVSTDCPYGPREILGHGQWGALVECGNAAGLTAAMRAALAAPAQSAIQCQRAAEFSLEAALEAYWQVLSR